MRKIYMLTGSILLTVILWWGVSLGIQEFRGVPFPGPGDVFREFILLISGHEMLLGHTFAAHIEASLSRWAEGYLTGLAAGLFLGLLMAISPRVDELVSPLIFLIHLVPGLAWIPVVILITGIGHSTTVLLIALAAFPPVTISLSGGTRAVPDEYLMVSGMCGDSMLRRFFCVQLPAALPHLMSGLRLALANSWRIVVAAEMVVGSGVGLGYSIIQSRWTLDYRSAFVCIGVIAFLGLIAEYGIFRPLERITMERWGNNHEQQ